MNSVKTTCAWCCKEFECDNLDDCCTLDCKKALNKRLDESEREWYGMDEACEE